MNPRRNYYIPVFEQLNEYKQARSRKSFFLDEWVLGMGVLGSVLLVAIFGGYLDFSMINPTQLVDQQTSKVIKIVEVPVSDVFKADETSASELNLNLEDFVQIRPSEDTFVSESTPERSYGSNTSLRVNASPVETAYLKFNVPNQEVKRAVLRFYARSNSSSGGSVRFSPDNLWTEQLLTFDSQLASKGEKVSDIGAVTARVPVDILVTDEVTSGSSVTFVLESMGGKAEYFASEAGTATSPVLLLEK